MSFVADGLPVEGVSLFIPPPLALSLSGLLKISDFKFSPLSATRKLGRTSFSTSSLAYHVMIGG